MSEIKLTDQPIGSETTGIFPDVDEKINNFSRLSFSFTNRAGEKL